MTEYAFGNGRPRPVSARKTRTGWDSTGISWGDYASMSTRQHKQSGERRLPNPVWAFNDKLLRELLVVFMESRLGLRPTKGKIKARLERARLAMLAQHPRLNETLDKLNSEYVQTQRDGVSAEEVARRNSQPPLPGFEEEAVVKAAKDRLAELEIEIEGLDTYLRYTRNGGAGVLAQVVYLYYRCAFDSVGVAEECGLKPPHVRQLLYRMNEVWKEKFSHLHSGMPEFAPEPLFDFLTTENSTN